MFTILSLVTSVKDYIEIVHTLVEKNQSNPFEIITYYDLGAICTYVIITTKDFLINLLTFKWLTNIGAFPLIIPNLASAMLSEMSVLDGYIHNTFTFLESPLSYGNQNTLIYGIEKFTIGLINSIFLCLPTSTAYIITLRRFVMQGLEAGYLAGLGTLAGNILWIGSILFGLRFIVIPWLSWDILRYSLGFLLLVKYMWDSYSEKRTVLEDLSKSKIFLLNFLLAFTEQATLYPFLNNLSIGADATFLESFPTNSFIEFNFIHLCYLSGLMIGGLSLLKFTCWFWENPAFNIYMWAMSSLKVTNVFSQKFVNIAFLYLTMFFAISNVSYFGLDYTLTKPLGLVHEDRLLDQKSLIETSFLNTKASDRNTRRNRGRHGRRERWKRRVRRYRTFDASLYDQGIYDLFTIEDLNYGFDRFWLRRKIRNHRVRFRFFPGPWMRSFKKQLARPRLESFMGPRVEFFRILFEQAYHPEFHEFRNAKTGTLTKQIQKNSQNLDKDKFALSLKQLKTNNLISFYTDKQNKIQKQNFVKTNSALRKFIRKLKTRTTTAEILLDVKSSNVNKNSSSLVFEKKSSQKIYSKRWKEIFSKVSHNVKTSESSSNFDKTDLNNFYLRTLLEPLQIKGSVTKYFQNAFIPSSDFLDNSAQTTKQNAQKRLSKKDRQILRYKTFLNEKSSSTEVITKQEKNPVYVQSSQNYLYKPLILLHPLKFYLQKEKGFQKKMQFYGSTIFRNFGIENNAPYYRVMMKKFFYYYKPNLRWERTLRTATMRKARRKSSRIPRKVNINKQTQALAAQSSALQSSSSIPLANLEIATNQTKIQSPTHFYSLVSKRATRYRYQIYKDVLQHWYYTPFNRLLLKFDVDSFIRRQPQQHFLTKKEENLLHLKRFLLADYYNTLRWYRYMQHYETMTANIGKTKSFASNTYNQQFFGTFKKIRHLFAITPTLSDSNVLKFDQPLFTEYSNSETSSNKNFSFYNSSIIHEELLADTDLYSTVKMNQSFPEDLVNQSEKIVKNYLQIAHPIRQEYIQKLLEDKNYAELTSFLLKGQKTRGQIPVTNEKDFLNQESNYLLNKDNQKTEKQKIQDFLQQKILTESGNFSKFESNQTFANQSSYIWISLLKKCRNQLYNQEALKAYVTGRVEKREKQKNRQQKLFNARLENIKKWVYLVDHNNDSSQVSAQELSGLTTSLQKAIKEGLVYQNFGRFSNKPIEKTNLRNNRSKVLLNLNKFIQSPLLIKKPLPNNTSVQLKTYLKSRLKTHALKTFETEQQLRENFSSIQNLMKQNQFDTNLQTLNPNLLTKVINQTLIPFKFVSYSLSVKLQEMLVSEKSKVFVQPFQKTLNVFTRSKEKNLTNWKHREKVLSTRKKIRRKIYRVLDQKKQREKFSNTKELETLKSQDTSTTLRQKQDTLDILENERRKNSWKSYEKNQSKTKAILSQTASRSDSLNLSTKNILTIFEKNFKKKRTRSRRYRRFKGRGPIKKHTLAEKFKRQFKLLKRYGGKQEGENRKMEILQRITKRNYTPNSFFETRETKQRRTRQSKHRFWKKHKRQKYLQVKRKLRKRRRYSISKLRVLNKEFKRIQNKMEIKKWWSQTFLPNFVATTDMYWENEKLKQIKQELDTLSISEILERDEVNLAQNLDRLQIGDQDFKPLGLPESLRLKEKLVEKGQLTVQKKNETERNLNSISSEMNTFNALLTKASSQKMENSILSNLSDNVLTTYSLQDKTLLEFPLDSKRMLNINPIPFYAGWDETLRQFVVTNRLLSRQEAGYSVTLPNTSNHTFIPNSTQLNPLKDLSEPSKIQFVKAPLQGMNAATTLYWQIPFTTYDPDQFFALGMDGFSPLAWRFFNLKHSKQTTKPLLVKNIFSTNEKRLKSQSLLSYNIQVNLTSLKSNSLHSRANSVLKFETQKISKNQARRIQKRQKRIKKHPRPPVWFPSGPLSNQVLPVHYIYVFYKRTRLPRDRYIGRRLRRAEDPKSSFLTLNFTNLTDFTLRKRVKPIRKYHRKGGLTKNQDNNLIVRRRPFKAQSSNPVRFRPMAKTRLTTQTDLLNSSLLKLKQRKRNLSTKQTSENLRIRQLRRRIQRQVLRPVSRYKPRSGGLVWPGDYLRLEAIKAPVLKTNSTSLTEKKGSSLGQIRKKKGRTLQEWQIQPKKYLLYKHNLQILKKRLEKAQNLNKLSQKTKELELQLT